MERITGVPTGGLKGETLDLNNASVQPSNATNKTILWTLMDPGAAGVGAIEEGVLTPVSAGTLELKAEILGGLANNALFSQDFTITITNDFIPVTGITGVPETGKAGEELDLTGARVSPETASRQTITWTVSDSGGTGLTGITQGKALPASTGTLTLTATITGGLGPEQDYTQDFTISIAPASNTTDTPEPETPKQLIGIEIASSPNTTLYAKNQPFDRTGLAVNKVYDDGSTEALAGGYTVDPVDTSMPGSKTVWVQWQNYETAFTVYVDTSTLILQELSLTKGPNKTEYYLGESFSTTGIVITGTYSDNTTRTFSSGIGVRGYDKYMRGPQTVSLTVNNRTFTVPVKVKVPANAEVSLNPYSRISTNHQVAFYKGTYIKGAAFEFEKSNLRAKVTVGGVTMTFTPGRGLYPEDILNFTSSPGTKLLTLNLDDKPVTFAVYVADVEPGVWFDFGYMRTPEDPDGIGPGIGKYHVKTNETLVLSPVRYLIGYNQDNSPGTVSYSWSVSGEGAYDTSAATAGETFAFKPRAAGTYTVQVQVSGRNYATGLQDTKIASVAVVSYTGAVSAEGKTFTPNPLKNFAPGQFTQSGTGYGWSLGAAGGYEVWSVPEHHDYYMITGNPMASWSEPGIVWVMEDRNENGIPDEMWYELAGSDDEINSGYKNQITRRWAVTYLQSSDTASVNEYGQTVAGIYWVDSKGRTGIIPGGWPKDWGVSESRVTYTGTLLRDTGEIATGSYSGLGNIGGYVDSFGYGKWAGTDTWNKFYISDGIRADGSPASLSKVRFIKVQSAVFHYGGIFGEVSTEIQSGDYLVKQSSFPSPAGGR